MKKLITMLVTFILVISSWKISAFAESFNILNAYEFVAAMQQFARDYTEETKVKSEQPIVNRLIVKTISNKPLYETYGAIDKLEGYGGLHILQYSNKNQTDLAYQAFLKDDILYVEYDYWMIVNSGNVKYCYCEHNQPNPSTQCMCTASTGYCDCEDNTSEGHYSWSSSAVMVDEAFAYLQNNKLEQVNVAVLDTGIDIHHSDFEGSNRFFLDEKYESIVISENGCTSDQDATYHGTHVAGIIFDNTLDNVKLFSYRLFDDFNNHILYSIFSLALNAVVDSGFIDVINMSIGMEPYSVEHENKTLYDILDRAVENNIVVVVAAGNDCSDANLLIPASYPNAIVVAATNKNNVADKAYSNYGVNVDVAAPGTDIYSTTPTKAGKVDSEGNPVYVSHIRNNGTSQATPLVSAAAAFILSIDPTLTPAEVERIIKETAYVPDDWEESCGGKNYGVGIVNFENIAKAMLGEGESQTPEIRLTSDNKFEISVPDGTDAKIYYTLDGSLPTIDNHLTYTSPLALRNTYSSEIIAVCHENGKLIGEPVSYDMITNKTKNVFCKYSYNLEINADAKNAYWSSYNPEIVQVDNEGNITANSAGKTKITCILPTGERIVWKVTVRYTPLQALFVLFFFGFLWI